MLPAGASLSQLRLCPGAKITSDNTPKLERIDLFNLTEDVSVFYLDLPELKYFSAEHTYINAARNSFGLSLSRCPKLEHVDTYKFLGMSGRTFCVLPNCESIDLHRSECTDSLDILNAPKLSSLSVQAAYNLHHLRLRDLLGAKLEDVVQLCEMLDDIEIKAREEADEMARFILKLPKHQRLALLLG